MSSSDIPLENHLRHTRYISELLDRKMTSSASTTKSLKHPFTRQVEEVKTPKSDINALILDYLTVAGYPNAAAKFSTEANLSPQQPSTDIHARQQIQTFIHKGEIESAIHALNDLNPSILDEDEPLHFALLRLQLVELIRKSRPGGDIGPALEFAQTQLGPKAPRTPQFLEDLEKTMSLLVFDHDNLDPSLAALLQPELRQEVADRVNKAIQQRSAAAIRHLVQMRAWSEEVVRKEGKKDLPARIDLGLDGDDSGGVENGHEPMITT
ncbi:CTLH/CRA C-terminal to lish motif domain-containing protein [Annulohypoxylon maeteangense]|uniref:CTLH/CRA C-terminal to lish motif domain-containing protein n=1 Tax=Annulohypoxylon maeteangense TaxID=1927788 RepID=UPI002008CCBE|nr:CTLH/CRA C-terminal to lish motif domain-containing protein [Annulohypoxylon maeteangense]KAI0889553.1 CTLH/CRA C-terminal to lish motif domain-containing protein [Annulohypoxylon maeteangense]